MFKIIIGVFLILHGLVHLLYFGQARRLFEMRPGMLWPDGSWFFSRFMGQGAARILAGTACTVATAVFVVAGVVMLSGQVWWRPLVEDAALLSTAIFFLFWDGKLHKLADQGYFAILINLAMLVAVIVFHLSV
ncbi:MAG: hypothetical protein WBV22_00350 [Anaerolineaceae bacterium]